MSDINSDEIDLIELVEIIWKEKIAIIGITSIAAIFSIAVALILPPSFEGKLQISSLDRTTMAAYAPLNDTPGISTPVYAGNELVGYEGVLKSDELFASVISAIRNDTYFLSLIHI